MKKFTNSFAEDKYYGDSMEKIEELEHDLKVAASFRKLYLTEKEKLSKLKQIILLTDDSVSDVEMNELTRRQWLAFITAFPDEAGL